MPRYTETIDLREELDRIDNELDELATESATLDSDNPRKQQLDERGTRLEKHFAGVSWALNPPEEELEEGVRTESWEEITIGSLSAGEYADLTDVAAADAEPGKSTAGSSTVLFAAKGLVDAPFLPDENPSDAQFISAVSNTQTQFQKWLAARVDEISTYDLEGNGYAARVAAAKEQAAEENAAEED